MSVLQNFASLQSRFINFFADKIILFWFIPIFQAM